MLKKAALLFLVSIFLPSVVFSGTAYYVDCSAASDGNGSYSSPWNNIGSVNNYSFSTGHDVYFKVNTTCTPSRRLLIDWDGSIADRVMIGAYYGEGKFGLNGKSRPIIDGNTTVPTKYEGLIQMQSESLSGHVTIKDLHIKNSYYDGILTKWVDDIEIDNCFVDHAGNNGIVLALSKGGSITNSIVDYAGYSDLGGSPSQACISVTALDNLGETDSITVSGNIVKRCFNEGIDIIRGATNCIVENNIVYDCNTVAIYLSNTNDAIVRHNLVYTSAARAPDGDSMAHGIWVQNETYTYEGFGGENHQIYGNLVASCINGLKLQSSDGWVRNNKIYNNTFVDNEYNFAFTRINGNWSGNVIMNNISWTLSDDAHHSNTYSPSSVTWSHNNFNDAVSGNAANNARIGNPGLKKTSGWRSLTAESVTGEEFRPESDSPVKNTGKSINGYNGRIISSNFATNPIMVRVETDSTPDIGAWMVVSESGGFRLGTPQNLEIVSQ